MGWWLAVSALAGHSEDRRPCGRRGCRGKLGSPCQCTPPAGGWGRKRAPRAAQALRSARSVQTPLVWLDGMEWAELCGNGVGGAACRFSSPGRLRGRREADCL